MADTDTSTGRGRNALPSIITFVVLVVAMFGAYLYGQHRTAQGFGTFLEEAAEKQRLVGAMQVNLLAATEAEKSAVMAATDEASRGFADDSRRAAAELERDRVEVARLIEAGGPVGAQASSREFGACWERHQALDREILGLAVENTNLRAQRLSFGSAGAALDRMQRSLEEIVTASEKSAEAATIGRAAFSAIASARKLHFLEGPHIVEAREAEMDRIEVDMAAQEAKVTEALGLLASAVGEPVEPSIHPVRAAFAEFVAVNKEVVVLSRKNSNVRSLAMSIGEKRKVTAECQALLASLREAIGQRSKSATR